MAWDMLRWFPHQGGPSAGQMQRGGWFIARNCGPGGTRGDSSEGPTCGVIYGFQPASNVGTSIIRTWQWTGQVNESGQLLGRFGIRAEWNGGPLWGEAFGDRLLPNKLGAQAADPWTPSITPMPWQPLLPRHPWTPGMDAFNPFFNPPYMGSPVHDFPVGPGRWNHPPNNNRPGGSTQVTTGVLGGRPSTSINASNPPRRPAGPNEREKKLNDSAAARVVFVGLRALAAYSEVNDFIDVLHRALPKERQARGGIRDRYEALWNNWRYVRWDAALAGYVQNEMEDQMVGRAMGRARQAAGAASGGDWLWRAIQNADTAQSTVRVG